SSSSKISGPSPLDSPEEPTVSRMTRKNFRWSSGFGPGRCFLIWTATREPVAAGAASLLSVWSPGEIATDGTGCTVSACLTSHPTAMISSRNGLSTRGAISISAASVEAGCTVPRSLASDRCKIGRILPCRSPKARATYARNITFLLQPAEQDRAACHPHPAIGREFRRPSRHLLPYFGSYSLPGIWPNREPLCLVLVTRGNASTALFCLRVV